MTKLSFPQRPYTVEGFAATDSSISSGVRRSRFVRSHIRDRGRTRNGIPISRSSTKPGEAGPIPGLDKGTQRSSGDVSTSVPPTANGWLRPPDEGNAVDSQAVQVYLAMNLRRALAPFTQITITTQLLLWFLIISLIPCALLTTIISLSANRSLKKTVRQGLLAIADAKATQLETFIRERRSDLNMVSRFTMLADSLPGLVEAQRKGTVDSATYLESSRKIRPYLGNFAESFGYSNAFLFDTDGSVLFQLKPDLDLGSNLLNGPLKGSELAEVFDRVRTLLQTEVSDYQLYDGRSEPAAFIASPVYSGKGLIIGFLAMELGNEQVFRVLKDYSGLGETGEAMVAMRYSEDEFIYVAPPRKSAEKALSYRGKIHDGNGTAMQKAIEGQRDYGEAIDYRGEPVVAAWSYLPSFRWGMVVKQDDGEAFALIYRQILVVALLLGATFVIVTVGALWLARTITRPIRNAAFVTERVAAGDLSVTCEGEAPGEMGSLLQAVRKMIQDLRSLIGKIQRSSITLLSTATEIAATSRQQEQAVFDYSASTNQAAAAVNEISATSHELLKTRG